MTIYLAIIKRPLKSGKCNIVFDIVNGKEYRKKIPTGITVFPSDWSNTRRRVKAKANNSTLLNKKINEFEERIGNALDFFHTGNWGIFEVVRHIEGKSEFNTVDDYIETEIKETRSRVTYQDYKNTVKAVKLHMNFDDKRKLLFQDINFSFLSKFKSNSKKNGLKGTSFNSYLVKLRAITNDAYNKNLIFTKVSYPSTLKRQDVQRQKIQTCNTQEFETAIDKITDIYEAQALGLYLLMFACRGMYPADIVSFTMANFENIDANDNFLCEEGYEYLVHRRSKTRERNNPDMYIRIDDQIILSLITLLKFSFLYTHFSTKPHILAERWDIVKLFNYSIDDDLRLHKNVWDIYSKKIVKVLGYSFKTARKTFNTYAFELKVSSSIRRILLGHSDPSELRSYDNLETDMIREQVEEAHMEVLEEFKVEMLYHKLEAKISTLNVPECMYAFGVYGYKNNQEFYDNLIKPFRENNEAKPN